VLSPLDDLLAHQIADTFDRVGTSDRNFFDRYYFNVHPCSGELFMIVGMGQYPNLGVTDAFVVVVHDGVQRVVRASRELGPNRLDTQVGPIGVEVIEGLRRLRVTCAPNEWDIDFDLVWEGGVPANEEPPAFQRHLARVVQDGRRFVQTGRWRGHLRIGDTVHDVTPDRWWGGRDHSWGIRPVGEPEPPGIRTTRPEGVMACWTPMQFADWSLVSFAFEDANGWRTGEGAARLHAVGSGRPSEHLGRPDYALEFEPGSRRLGAATITLPVPDADPIVVRAQPMTRICLDKGTGYGADPDWRHGMYQGPLKVEGLQWDQSELLPTSTIEASLCRYESGGEVGYGVFDLVVVGVHRPSGFLSPTDVGPPR
jgi:hypothetical protein